MKQSRIIKVFLPIVFCLAVCLTGCVDYEVGVNFSTPYSGEITQHIRVDEKLTSLAASDTRKWLNSLEKRSRQLNGNVKKLDSQELLLTIPFGNGAELAQKFNKIFQTVIIPDATIPQDQVELIELNSQVDLQQNNLVFVERNSIDLAIDLRAMGILSKQDNIVIEPNSLANLRFELDTPWIAYSVDDLDNLQPIKKSVTKGLIWQLQPGEVNHIKAVFWLPSPIGLGAAAIVLLMVMGFLLKYRRFPGVA